MTSFKLFGAALILSTAFATPVFSQTAGLPEMPGNFAFFSPQDDFGPAVRAVQPVQPVRPVRSTPPHRAHQRANRSHPT
jgi:hypothetical protein